MKNAYLLMREITLDVELPGPKIFLIFFFPVLLISSINISIY